MVEIAAEPDEVVAKPEDISAESGSRKREWQ